MAAPFLSVVIPAYNEEARIAGTLEQVLAYLGGQGYSWEVVVADDGSTDATPELVARLAEERGSVIHYLKLPHGGKGWAVKQGMLKAQGEYRFMCDADLSMPIEQVARFLPPQMADYDIAIGSRSIPGARRLGEPAMRKAMAKGFSLLVRGLALPGIADSQCGFKCFQAEAAERLFPLQKLHGFAFDVELLFLARKLGLRTVEVPIDWYHSPQSKVKPLRDASAMTRDILRVRWNYRRRHYRSSEPGPSDPRAGA